MLGPASVANVSLGMKVNSIDCCDGYALFIHFFLMKSMVKDKRAHIINNVNTMEDIRNILACIEVGLDNIEVTLSEFAPAKSE
jgi:hypothetical protein